MAPKDLKYSKTHEWIRFDSQNNQATIGITDFAIAHLGDIVYLELPNIGDETTKDSPAGAIESVKAASELCAPVSGTIIEVNEALGDNLESMKEDPYGQSWIMKIEVKDPSELQSLMDASKYEQYAQSQEEELA